MEIRGNEIMVTYYKIGDMFCASAHGDLPYEKTEKPAAGTTLTWLFTGEPGSRRASFLVNHPAELFAECEDVSWLNTNRLNAYAYDGQTREFPAELLAQLDAGTLRAVNASHPKFKEILEYRPKEGKKRVHVLAIGDVGSMLLTGLHLLGGDVISSIGICDISDKVTARWEFEENQIAYPWDYDAMPEVDVVDQEHLFDCDVFVFVASKGIPPVGSGVKDVRMYQFENNSKIIGHYAKMAREKNFKGLFCAVSDPVDPLAKTAFLESNKNEAGEYDWMGLLPEQIQGFGLGVMNARAAYYAKRDPRFKQFLTEGRSFGPHGQDLVIADSIEDYNDELSKELTNLTVTANLHMRAIGYKPFVAPAFSSGAISILMTLRKQWHCGSVFLGGVYMGVKNRYTEHGLETETLALPDALYERIVFAAENLAKIV